MTPTILTHRFLPIILILLILTACASDPTTATQIPITRVTLIPPIPTFTAVPTTIAPTTTATPTQRPTSTGTIVPTLTNTPMIVTDSFSRPQTPAPYPTPLNLSAVSEDWLIYDFPDLGVSLTMPSDWELLRYPDGYFFAPIDNLPVQLTVGLKTNTPTDLQPMIDSLTAEFQDLTPFEFYTTTMTISSIESAAFWNISPASCVDLYIPAHNIVRNFSFYSTFCNEAHDQLNEVGRMIVDSIELYPPQ